MRGGKREIVKVGRFNNSLKSTLVVLNLNGYLNPF